MKSQKGIIKKILNEEHLLISKEKKSLTGHADLSVVLAYPDIYEHGLPNLGHQCLYAALRKIPWIDVSRVYLPWYPQEFEENHILLFSWETDLPIKKADVITFTISYEGLFPNVLRILQLAGIPLFTSDRDSSYPLIIAGGPCPTYNPEPIAPFIDAFVIGEGEEAIVDIMKICWSRAFLKSISRKSIFTQLEKIDGVYVPSLIEVSYDSSEYLTSVRKIEGSPRKIKRRQYDLFPENPAKSIIITPRTIYGENTFSLEITRGCVWQCKFCYLGHGCGKYRAVPISTIIYHAKNAIKLDCALKLFFEGTPQYYLHDIIHSLASISKRGDLKLRIGSLRVDVIERNIVDLIYQCGQDSLTVAPETSQSLRQTIGKSAISDEIILYGAELAANKGFKKYCMYFMLGLPGEGEDDMINIAKLIKNTRYVMDSAGGSSAILEAHINPFFPKPHTPFQEASMDSVLDCERKLNLIISALKKRMSCTDRILVQRLESTIIGGQEPVKKNFPEHSILIKTIIGSNIHYIQPLLARGSRKMAEVLNKVYPYGLNKDVWYRTLRKNGLNPNIYFGSWNKGGKAPWSLISHV